MSNIFDIIFNKCYNRSMKYKQLIGKLIKEKRLLMNLRMDDLARYAGITRATLWSIENGKGNYSIDSLLVILDLLKLSLNISLEEWEGERNRASRINKVDDKKINRFIIMCVEQYANSVQMASSEIYKQMNEKGIFNELTNDYRDLHGMSTIYLNDYIASLMGGNE